MATTVVEQPQAAPKGRFISIRWKLLLAFTLLFGLIYAATFYWFYTFSSNRAVSRLGDDLSVLIDGAAGEIDGDELRALIEEGNYEDIPSDERYQRQLEWLQTIKKVDSRANTYTMAQGEDAYEYMILVDAGQEIDPEAPTFGTTFEVEPEEVPAEFLEVFDGTRDSYILLEPYQDEFGQWISGYRAVKDSDGEVVAVVGADFEADYYYEIRRQVEQTALQASLIVSLVVVVAVWAISSYLARPITALRDRAALVGEGKYEQDFSSLTNDKFPDEIDTLAKMFELMVSKVYQRETQLRERVKELEIMIDTSKRDEQVSEIVDSEFFSDLRTKANDLRKKSQSQRGGGDR